MGIPGSANPLLLVQQGSTQYTVSRSIRLNSSDSAYLSRTPSSAGNRRTWTISCWVKRSGLGTTQRLFSSANSANTQGFYFEIKDGNTFDFYDYSDPTLFWRKTTTQVFRDTGAWFHLQLAFDSTNATAGDRVKLYINEGLVTAYSISSDPSLNYDSFWNAARAHAIGRTGDLNAAYFSGYLADVHFIDGQALTPSSFTEVSATTGQLIPKAYTGSYGTNGFKLDFADNSAATAAALGKDTSGNGNNWTPNNLSVTAGAGNDSLVDTPTSYGTDDSLGGSVRGNYCTWNPLNIAGGALANGNLDLTNTGGGRKVGAFAVSSGKWYWEVSVTSAGDAMIGAMPAANPVSTGSANFVGGAANEYGYYQSANKYTNGTATSYGATFGNGDVIGVALDLDAGTLVYYKNGVSQGTAFTGISGTYAPAVSAGGASGASMTANFGQRPFAYPVSGFKALCDTNLPAPVVAKPSTAFDTKLYTGNGTTQNITGLGFSPDLVWIKVRNYNIYYHELVDSVRGVNKSLFSNATDAEATINTLTAFNSDGFTVGTNGGANFGTNENSRPYVAWAWDAGSSTVTNTQGSITSTVRANASAGFSIVTWTAPSSGSGWTVGHGLGAAPFLMIDKCRSNTGNWTVYHQTQGATKALYLNTTDSVQTSSMYWNDTAPSSTVFTCGTTGWYGAGFTHVTYCFAPVVGYSSMGSYTGNGSVDGPFVWTGFRPRWILFKNASTTSSWMIIDAARVGFNNSGGATGNAQLYPDLAVSEDYNRAVDILSNGFKIRNNTSTETNGNTNTIIYCAFAESPLQYARAR